MEKSLKKYILFTLGAFTLGLGVSLCNYANLGVDPMTVFMQGLSKIIHVSLGTMNLFGSIVMMLIGYVYDKKYVTWATIAAMFIVSLGIDSLSLLHLPSPDLVVRYLCLIAGVLVYTFGIGLSQVASCGLTAFDCMMFGFMKLMNKEYHFVRWVVEGVALGLGILLNGTFGICTIIIILFAGKLVEFFVELLTKK